MLPSTAAPALPLRSLPPYCSPSLIKFEFTSTYLLGWEPISYRNHHSPSHEIKDSQFSFANFGFSSGTKYNSKLVDKLTSLKIRFVLRTRTKQHVTLATLDLKHVVMLSTVTLARLNEHVVMLIAIEDALKNFLSLCDQYHH